MAYGLTIRGERERNPRFCSVVGGMVVKDAVYRATHC